MTIKVGLNDREVSLEWAKGYKEGLEQAKRLFDFYLGSGSNSVQEQIDSYKSEISRKVKENSK